MLEASTETASIIRDNWHQVVERVAEACRRAGRNSSEVTIVGVTKYVGVELTHQLAEAGCRVLGENRPQVLWEKCAAWPQQANPQAVDWHLIGHLQRNKVRRTLPLVSLIHSVDSLRLIDAMEREAEASERTLEILLEVNVTQDQSKTGMQRETTLQAMEYLEGRKAVAVRGLMAMSTHHATTAQAQAEFAQVRELRDDLSRRFPSFGLSQLSMGMSGDFEAAIAEGATLVRIGSSIWEGIR